MEQMDVLLEKEVLVQLLDNSTEYFQTNIQKQETSIKKAIIEDWRFIEGNLLQNQHNRNRSIVKEILTTSCTFTNEIKNDFTNLRGEDDEQWINIWITKNL